MTGVESYRFSQHLANVYFTIFSLFCFKLFVKISLAILTHFYIVKGNRKEAARIAAEFYGATEGQGSWADRSPLHEAASQGRLLSLKTLLAQVNATTIDGVTPLFNACSSGSANCAELVLQNGAKLHGQDCWASAIHEASSKGRSECIQVLISWGADIDLDISHQGTPLYVACVHQQYFCIKKLLHAGANVQKGKHLETPLHAAARQSNPDIVMLLLDFGAEVRARNAEGERPIDVAVTSSSVDRLLLHYEATPSSLCQLCRLCVRNCLGRPRLQYIPQLQLPKLLKDFLQHQ
ncbi:ankyrin repeat and SOCS box protein 5b isoform X3 [Hemitrygon akajei]|uniref:ankyrin repeat and SOCS box protein 5b isoform X3 n=1 Tax=Hemitrygon akajei TaxID=2704970 RepID=UPI003BF9F257